MRHRMEPLSQIAQVRTTPPAILGWTLRAAIIVLLLWPVLLVSVIAQQRLAEPAPPAVLTFVLTLFFAKAALVSWLGGMLERHGRFD